MTYRLAIIGESHSGEVWKPTHVNGYEVSSQGGVRSYRTRWHTLTTPRVLKPGLRSKNHPYLVVAIGDRKGTKIAVHRLVAAAFHGPCPDGFECAHLNGNPLDNRAENLKWCSPAENQSHRLGHGTLLWGESYFRSKLTLEQVREARELWATAKKTPNELARQFGVSRASMWKILRWRTYKHDPEAPWMFGLSSPRSQ